MNSGDPVSIIYYSRKPLSNKDIVKTRLVRNISTLFHKIKILLSVENPAL